MESSAETCSTLFIPALYLALGVPSFIFYLPSITPLDFKGSQHSFLRVPRGPTVRQCSQVLTRLSVLYMYIHLITRIEDNPLEGEVVLQGPTWTLRCWSPARLGKTCLCIIGSLWTGDHRFVSRFPSCSYMETSSLGRKLLSSSESAPCELYCYIIIILNSF